MHIVTKWAWPLVFAFFSLPLLAFQITGSVDADLSGTYSNKIVRDFQQKLHIAYVTGQGDLRYQNGSIDGTTWTPFGTNSAFQFNNYFQAVTPAIDVDNWHNVGIVFIDETNNNGEGTLYYFYKNPQNTNQWFYADLENNASQPSIAMRSGKTHLTWIQDNQVKYMTFPYSNPPSNGEGQVEVVASSGCKIEKYAKPSIGLVKDRCVSGTPVIGYLAYTSYYNPLGLQCPETSTKVGPRVMLRDSVTQIWTEIYNDVRSVPITNPFAPLETTSLALSTYHEPASIYLAYADKLNGSNRTKIAVGNRTTWNNQDLSTSEAMHIDILANPSYNGGEFRIAYQDSFTSSYRTGKWQPSGSAPNWSESPQTIGSSSINQAPHAIFGKYCKPNQTSVHSITEFNFQNSTLGIVIDTNLNQCANSLIAIASTCYSKHLLAVLRSPVRLAVSLEDAGFILEEPGPNSLEYFDGENRYVIFWEGGELEEFWPKGFILSGNPEITVLAPEGFDQPEILYFEDNSDH